MNEQTGTVRWYVCPAFGGSSRTSVDVAGLVRRNDDCVEFRSALIGIGETVGLMEAIAVGVLAGALMISPQQCVADIAKSVPQRGDAASVRSWGRNAGIDMERSTQ